MKCHHLFIHFLTVGVVANTVQIAAANENNELRLGYLANEDSSISAIGKASQADLQPAEVFVPYLGEIQESIPPDLILRLPSQIAGDDTSNGTPLEEAAYTVRVFSFDSPPSLMVGLYRCNDGSPSCLMNSFSVDRQSSITAQNTLQHHQATGIPTALTSDIRGYLLEEHQSGSLQPSVSIVWEQDGMIYTVSSLVSEQQNVINMAQSMANADPIGSPASTQMLPAVDEPLLENPESPDVDTAISENAGEDLGESATPIDLSSDLSSDPSSNLTPSDQNSTMVPSVPSNSSTESLDASSDKTPLSNTELVQAQGQVALDQPPRPLPNELEIDESGGQFPLGVIRPIPVLSISSSFSIFTNNNLRIVPLTESTAFPISASLIFSPELGDRTRLVANLGGSYINFTTTDDYIALNAGLGIFQDLGDQMSLGVGWSYQQTYSDGFNDISEHTAYLSWSRVDELVERRLFLDSNYFLSANFAQDEQQSRLVNSAGLGLNYSFTPKFQGRLGYRLVYESFFENEDALRHQLSGQLSYQLNPNIFIGTSVSYLFGEQVDLANSGSADAVNNISFGLHFGVNLPLLY